LTETLNYSEARVLLALQIVFIVVLSLKLSVDINDTESNYLRTARINMNALTRTVIAKSAATNNHCKGNKKRVISFVSARSSSNGQSFSFSSSSQVSVSGSVSNQRKSVRASAAEDDNDGDERARGSSLELYAGALGVVACAVTGFSLFTLKSTGCGLPAGPNGIVGAIEGVSYLGVAALIAASAYAKKTTGKGLPAGPFALLGAAEGVAYLLLLAGVYVGVAQVTEYGYIPNAVPVEGGKCA
jgi:hypothetical protein